MIGFSAAVSGLSAHFTAGSSQLMHWRSVRPEMVTTGTIRFPHLAQRVIRSMTSSSIFFTSNPERELLFHRALAPADRCDGTGAVPDRQSHEKAARCHARAAFFISSRVFAPPRADRIRPGSFHARPLTHPRPV